MSYPKGLEVDSYDDNYKYSHTKDGYCKDSQFFFVWLCHKGFLRKSGFHFLGSAQFCETLLDGHSICPTFEVSFVRRTRQNLKQLLSFARFSLQYLRHFNFFVGLAHTRPLLFLHKITFPKEDLGEMRNISLESEVMSFVWQKWLWQKE